MTTPQDEGGGSSVSAGNPANLLHLLEQRGQHGGLGVVFKTNRFCFFVFFSLRLYPFPFHLCFSLNPESQIFYSTNLLQLQTKSV